MWWKMGELGLVVVLPTKFHARQALDVSEAEIRKCVASSFATSRRRHSAVALTWGSQLGSVDNVAGDGD